MWWRWGEKRYMGLWASEYSKQTTTDLLFHILCDDVILLTTILWKTPMNGGGALLEVCRVLCNESCFRGAGDEELQTLRTEGELLPSSFMSEDSSLLTTPLAPPGTLCLSLLHCSFSCSLHSTVPYLMPVPISVLFFCFHWCPSAFPKSFFSISFFLISLGFFLNFK